jgi:UDP-N-acetyl-D-glucosamine dehydrogenase
LRSKVSIIGLGYVGLPLCIAAVKSNYEVVGVDLDVEKVKLINRGKSYVEDILDSEILALSDSGNFKATVDYNEINGSEIIVICVPTPLSKNNQPDLSIVESASRSIANFIYNGTLIILESTVMPGTTRNFLIPNLEQGSKLDRGEFDVAFSPERIDPMNKTWTLRNTPKIVSGFTPQARQRASDFYSKFVDKVIKCESLEVAETAKLLENSFRFVNISFINEISIFCHKLGIEPLQVISAASSKPYGFMPFYPSIGIGGHCIPVDPLYLANKAREIGAPIRFIDLADQINQGMPSFFVGRAEEKIGVLKGKKVLVIGVSYKPNVADVRETPVEALILGLRNKGAEVFWHDDLVKEWNGERSAALSQNYDLAILATPHDYIDLTKLGDVPILNTRGSI